MVNLHEVPTQHLEYELRRRSVVQLMESLYGLLDHSDICDDGVYCTKCYIEDVLKPNIKELKIK